MADLPTSFWGGWITVLTAVSFAGLVWLLFSIYFGSDRTEDQPHAVWDENLNEGNNPAPIWWFWLIFSAMIFSVIYLVLYPGLGTFTGALKWSQGHRLEEAYEHFRLEYAELQQTVLRTPIAELQQDELVMISGRGIFERNCAACHGPDGRGMANRFPDLRDGSWQWGGTSAQIEQTIRQGRRAVMPAWAATLDDQRVTQVVDFLRMLGQSPDTTTDDAGRQTYNQFCSGCHGNDGTGNTALGAPDLTDTVWLYGGDMEALMESVRNGRSGIMPAFENRLSDVQIRMLIAWLSNQPVQQ
jgi:cytochrome c oxidase cbb3-type subunit 3